MSEVIVVIDLSSFGIDSKAFESIGMAEKFDEYNNNEGIDNDIHKFYYECLADYIITHLKDNKSQQVKRRFIIYFHSKNQKSTMAEEIIISYKSNSKITSDEELEYLDLAIGDKSLLFKITFYLNKNVSALRLISIEKQFFLAKIW